MAGDSDVAAAISDRRSLSRAGSLFVMQTCSGLSRSPSRFASWLLVEFSESDGSWFIAIEESEFEPGGWNKVFLLDYLDRIHGWRL